MTDMSPDWEEWRGWSDETGPDQGNFLYIGVLLIGLKDVSGVC